MISGPGKAIPVQFRSDFHGQKTGASGPCLETGTIARALKLSAIPDPIRTIAYESIGQTGSHAARDVMPSAN